MTPRRPDMDAVVAAADLIGRAGANGFEIAWTCPHAPDIDDGHSCPDVTWTCSASFRGRRLFTNPYGHPAQAANALALKILDGAVCRCGQPVVLFTGAGCLWKRTGERWEPSCDAEPLDLGAMGVERGDLVGMNRATRRLLKKRKRR